MIKEAFESYPVSIIVVLTLANMFFYTVLDGLAFWIIAAVGNIFLILISPFYGTAITVLFVPALLIAVYAPLLILKILVYLFIRTPLHFLNVSTVWIAHNLEISFQNLFKEKEVEKEDSRRVSDETEMIRRPKLRYLFFYGSFLFLFAWAGGLFESPDMAWEAPFLLIPLFFIPLIVTLAVSWFGGRVIGDAGPPDYEEKNIERPSRPATDEIEKGKQVYENLERVKDAHEFAEETGLKGSILRTAKEVSPRLAGLIEGGGAASMALALIAILIIWLIIVISLWGIAGGLIYAIIGPFIAETFGPVIGLTADYGTYGSAMMPDVVPDMDDIRDAFSEEFNAGTMALARLNCVAQGPECLQEWRDENRRTPGAEAVGQQFGLDIEEIEVNLGQPVDISTRTMDDTVNVYFRVENEAQGIYGIDAENTEYNFRIEGGPESCETGWQSIEGLYAEEGRISAGGVGTPATGEVGLTLEDCGMLQPGDSSDYTAELDVRYEYSSQSTVDVQVMDIEHMREAGISSDVTQSETADTPVQAFVNVEDPVTFSSDDDALETSSLFASFETESFGTEYIVQAEDVEISSSVLLRTADEVEGVSGSCDDLNRIEGDRYNLSEEYAATLRDEDDSRWYSRGFGPSAASCDVVVDPEEAERLSPTGETATLTINANYTTKISDDTTFQVENANCALDPDLECPPLPPKEEADTDAVSSTCSTDVNARAFGGCTVVEYTNQWMRQPEIINDDHANLPKDIERGETAFKLETVLDQFDEASPEQYINEETLEDFTREDQISAVGLERDPYKIGDEIQTAVLYWDGSGISLGFPEDVDSDLEEEWVFCEETDEEKIRDFLARNILDMPSSDDILVFNAEREEESYIDSAKDFIPIIFGDSCPAQD